MSHPTNFFEAAAQGYLGLVRAFLDSGLDPDVLLGGKSALYAAAETGQLDVVNLLLERGATVAVGDNSPVLGAAIGGHLPVLRAFVAHGHSLDVRDSIYTALHRAAAGGHADVVSYLIEQGVPVDSDDNHKRRFDKSPLWMAVFHGHLDCARLLLAAGADPRETPLNRTSAKMVELLLAAGVDPNAVVTTHNGKSLSLLGGRSAQQRQGCSVAAAGRG